MKIIGIFIILLFLIGILGYLLSIILVFLDKKNIAKRVAAISSAVVLPLITAIVGYVVSITKLFKKDKTGALKVFIFSTATMLYTVILLLVSGNFKSYSIKSNAMLPTLSKRDVVLIYKIKPNEVDRGDIVTFKYPEKPSIVFVKRVIGVPGDIVEVKNDIVSINGKPLHREKIGMFALNKARHPIYKECIIRELYNNKELCYKTLEIFENEGKDFGPIKVPSGYFFVMGDNRDNSRDSRFFGFVPAENILGKAFFVYRFDLSKIKLLN